MPKKKKRPLFGTIVKMELLKQNMTNRELARSIGIRDSTLSDVIMGRNLSITTKTKIVEALHLPDSVLWLQEGENSLLEYEAGLANGKEEKDRQDCF